MPFIRFRPNRPISFHNGPYRPKGLSVMGAQRCGVKLPLAFAMLQQAPIRL